MARSQPTCWSCRRHLRCRVLHCISPVHGIYNNFYYRNVNNNGYIFDYIIGEAEEQECKEDVPGLLFSAQG